MVKASTLAAAQVDRAIFEREYNRFWGNYCRLVTQPDRLQFDRLVEPLINIALGIRQPLYPELWLSS